MLPAMTVPAYAAVDETVVTDAVLIRYVDMSTSEEIHKPTLLYYEDLEDGAYSITPLEIEGYTPYGVWEFIEGNAGGKSHTEIIKSGNWVWTSNLSRTLSSEDAWAAYTVRYENDKYDDGFVCISSVAYNELTQIDADRYYYYDDMPNGEFAIDINRAGYHICCIEVGEFVPGGATSYEGVEVPADGIFAGTLTQGDKLNIRVEYERDTNAASFNSVLLLSENSSVPNATINYSIEPGTGIAAVPGTSMAVLAPSADTGVSGTPTISNAVFAPGDATVTSVDGVTIDAGEKAVVKPISIDFSGVSFAQPGIFRYIISEPSSGNNRNASDEYEIGGFVLHEVAGAVNEGETTAADKSSGFVNEYNTTGLTLECQVEGNQSSIDKYFAYTITMQNPGNSAFNVAADWSNASGAQNPVANPATSYTNEVITAANTNEWTSNADGSMSKTIYLKDGQKVALDGIPVGTAYSITVAEEDYGPSWVVGSDNGSNDATGNRTLNAVEDVVFTLTREGVVPTGVALSILPGIILMGAAAAFFFVMKNRKREEASEA